MLVSTRNSPGPAPRHLPPICCAFATEAAEVSASPPGDAMRARLRSAAMMLHHPNCKVRDPVDAPPPRR